MLKEPIYGFDRYIYQFNYCFDFREYIPTYLYNRPKQKSLQLNRMRLYVSEFGSNVLFTDGLVLYCKVCEVDVSADKKLTI
jgi:hypothetical protein